MLPNFPLPQQTPKTLCKPTLGSARNGSTAPAVSFLPGFTLIEGIFALLSVDKYSPRNIPWKMEGVGQRHYLWGKSNNSCLCKMINYRSTCRGLWLLFQGDLRVLAGWGWTMTTSEPGSAGPGRQIPSAPLQPLLEAPPGLGSCLLAGS